MPAPTTPASRAMTPSRGINSASKPFLMSSASKQPLGSLTPRTPRSMAAGAAGGMGPSSEELAAHESAMSDMLSVLAMVTNEYRDQSDEAASINRMQAEKAAARQELQGKRDEIRQIINELHEQVQELAQITANPPAIALQQEQAALIQQRDQHSERIAALSQQVAAAESAQAAAIESGAALTSAASAASAAARSRAHANVDVAKMRRLYEAGSSVHWNYDLTGSGSQVVAGTFHFAQPPTNAVTLKPFKIDATQGRFAVANQMWDAINQHWDGKGAAAEEDAENDAPRA